MVRAFRGDSPFDEGYSMVFIPIPLPLAVAEAFN